MESAPIAIIGIACRLPGAKDYNEYWQNLEQGINSISEIPAQRWDVEKYYSPNPGSPNKTISKWAGLIEGIDQFDAQFFGISSREAGKVDPQHRIMLELSWSCIEDAGYSLSQVSGKDIGVFIGACNYDSILLMNQNQDNVEGHSGTGTWTCMIPNRISSFFNLHGPSIPIDTACSSSLVAIHYALKSLKESECEMALVGGISVLFTSTTYIQMSQLAMLSPTGQCRTFSSDADGYVRGEGAGVVLLKPLTKAIKDGDRIYGVIQGSAINHGGKARTITSPNVYAQAQVIRSAYTKANISPNTVSYIESHGTGTPLGDPIEINALKRAYRQLYHQYGVEKTEKPYCGIGAVKSNIGHLEGAAGIAGLIKVLLAMKYKKLPKIVNFKELNPRINIKDSPFYFIEETQEWKRLKNESGEVIPRRAGLSSFGIGGVNAHIVLEEPQKEIKTQNLKVKSDIPERPQQILTISGQTEKALRELATKYETYLQSEIESSLQNICFSANTGRTDFAERLALVAKSKEELQEKLADFLQDNETNGVVRGKAESQEKEIAFLFTGQGSQYVEMGRQLYETQPTFQKILDQCNEILKEYLEVPLLEVIYPQNAQKSSISLLDQTAYTQPALFALEYALAKLWESWGIKPNVAMGHSVGEYVAATVAGVFSLEDGLKLIAMRGRLMQQLPSGGEMVSVMASESQVTEAIGEYSSRVTIAAINGPESIVISGESEAIASICSKLESEGVKTKQLQVSHAFHSPLMEPMLAKFETVAKQVTYSQPKIPLISNVTGKQVGAEITTPEYWVRHVRQPVRFAQSMKTLDEEGYELFLEIGPKPILLGMGRQCLPEDVGVWLTSLRPGVEEWQQMLLSLGKLYVQGAKIDWLGLDSDYTRQKVSLPTYPFQGQRYWIETNQQPNQRHGQKQIHPLLGHKIQNASTQQIFQSYLKADSPTYLSDHQVFEKVLFPATGYLEIAYSAARAILKAEEIAISELSIAQGLILPTGQIQTIQTILTPLENNHYKFQVYSTQELENQPVPQWILHTEGKIHTNSPSPISKLDLEKYKKACTQAIDISAHYQQFQKIGIKYGSSFQGVKELWQGPGQAIAQICLPAELTQITEYNLHPALLDAALQIIAYTVSNTQKTEQTYLPIGISKYQLYHAIPTRVWAVAEITTTPLTANVFLVDNQGKILAEINGLKLRATTASALLKSLSPDISHWYYQIDWQPQPLQQGNPPTSQINKWLVFTTETQIVQVLEEQGIDSIRVTPGTTYQQLTPKHYQINPQHPEEYIQLLQNHPSITGIIHHQWYNQSPANQQVGLQTNPEQTCSSLLHLVQAIIKTKPETRPKLCIITSDSQSVHSETELTNPESGSLWGLGQVISLEHPELKCQRIDYDSQQSQKTKTLTAVVAEIQSQNKEYQIAIRNGVRYVARLVPQNQQHSQQENQPIQLKLSKYGIIDNLNWQPMERRCPSANEVEIQVATVGLNLRDVLNALGLLQEYYREKLGISSTEQLTFGFECAGTIVAVGEKVSQWQIGDEVIATMIQDGFSSFVTLKAEYVMPKPQQMSFSEAATLPLTFLTANYGLKQLAQIQPGEKILIHAAAGGVGQAAVQIAQGVGAEIYATASPGKWEFLRSLGIKHIYNSRTLDWAVQIMTDTEGKGVDVVLNSLNGEYIDKSIEVLATGGRFVEIGKIGIWSTEQVTEKRADVKYFPFDLGEVVQQQPDIISQLSKELTPQWNKGKLKALPYKVFSSKEVTSAFSYMQQAQHIGKVVVSMPEVKKNQISIQPQASYLITGGLGALGLEVAQWMVKQGAKQIVLTGRRSPNQTAQKVLSKLEATGTSISVLLGDISVEKDVAEIFQKMQKLLPLKGVIHAAGVLDDKLVQNMSTQHLAKVMAPKVAGTWNLHQMTKDLELDFFVCFSSITSMLGNSGQGNYAAANAFMDAFAHYRRGQGLPGLSINWGPWAFGGMAASLETQHQNRSESIGIRKIQPEEGMVALENLLSGSQSQVGVFPVNWSQFLTQVPGVEKMPLLSELISTQPSLPQKSGLLEKLEAIAVRDRMELFTTHIQSMVAQTLGLTDGQKLERRQPLFDLGLDSLMAVELKNRLESSLQTSLSSTLLFDYPTLEALVEYLADVIPIEFSITDSPQVDNNLSSFEGVSIEALQSETEPIAIIGMSCRFPGGANSPEAFWEILNQGIDAISEVPQERWKIDEYYDPNPDTPGKIITRYGGFLSQVDRFDAPFFGISRREAQSLDPQQRLLLEVSWEAIERANLLPEELFKTQTGVFIGICTSDYSQQLANFGTPEAYWGTGSALSAAAGRLSYILGLTGPSLSVDTACSSSLVSVHLACQSLRNRESELALAGGVNFLLSPDNSIVFSHAKMLSPDGRCKTFDAEANGYVRSEGCGVIILKRLSDAVAHGDNILAVIRGSAINQDGASGGLTVPNGPSQQAVIRQALENSGVAPASISYIEAHGTGTSLGDPIEVGSVGEVFKKTHTQEKPVIMGSVKSNIGHLEGAAGIAGLMKVVLQLQHQQIVPSLHFHQPNPYISWEQLPVEVSTQMRSWPNNGQARVAGVSSFGFSGTNAHIVLEETPIEGQNQSHRDSAFMSGGEEKIERSVQILTLSGKTEKALSDLVKSYQNYLQAPNNERKLADICYTANTSRAKFDCRLAIISSNRQELVEKLQKYTQGESVAGIYSGEVTDNSNTPKIAFLFTGQGSQYVNMSRQLYETAPVFRAVMNQCDEILSSELEESLLNILYQDNNDSKASLLNQTGYTQPALFAIEYALFKLWESWGIKPSIVMGHSVGEIVAATVAGVWSLEEGLKLIASRGRLMQKLPSGGEMVSVMASESVVSQYISSESEVAIAAINGPESTVISGSSMAIKAIVNQLEAKGIKIKQLEVSHAFHSQLMEPMLAEFEAVANQITYNQPKIPVISNVTGTIADDSIASAQYWVNHVRQPVRFAQGMETLHKQGAEIFLEIGPKPILLGMGRECLMGAKKLWLSSLRSGKPDWLQMLQSLGELYIRAIKIDWLGFERDYFRKKVALPTYPWQRKRYWITDIQQRKSQNKKSITSELEKVQPDGVNIQQEEIQTNKDLILQQPKLKLSEPESLSFPKTTSVTELPPKIKLAQLTVQVKPVQATQQNIESENITQFDSLDKKDVAQIRETLKESLAEALYADISEIEEHKKFVDLGLDSIVGVEWITNINKIYNLKIKATKLYDYPTLSDLAKYIAQILSTQEKNIDVERSPSAQTGTTISNQSLKLTDSQNNFSQVKETLKQQLAEALYVDISEIEEHKKFVDLGLDSIVGVEWITEINKTYNLNIKATKLYDYPTLLELAKYITQEIYSTGGSQLPKENKSIEDKESIQKDYVSGDSQEEMKQKLRSILKKVANGELTVQEGNQMIQKIKNQVKI
ncbi:MAG: SDR family NAD(P)-dependent oxidoreductase [Okeania sp. SIO2C9]|uniref:type I polyketide synthase n=1 Tax=Okeania sp. SIO2C9 TaxID=2607791 RepID=UPI0013BFB418|nr:type I polyketide synthase [Okeania sp. SIO2C9]NEQ72612.1 SDR family NAD(P)-dependent oxidoreductase [Okeania sp. SIO2C9]